MPDDRTSYARLLRAFCDALATGEPGALESILDDVEWLIYGPFDLFPLFGEYHGKDAVLAMCMEWPSRRNRRIAIRN